LFTHSSIGPSRSSASAAKAPQGIVLRDVDAPRVDALGVVRDLAVLRFRACAESELQALPVERAGQAGADAAAGTGDQGDAVLEIGHGVLLAHRLVCIGASLRHRTGRCRR
jgi:hypothetical protein